MKNVLSKLAENTPHLVRFQNVANSKFLFPTYRPCGPPASYLILASAATYMCKNIKKTLSLFVFLL